MCCLVFHSLKDYGKPEGKAEKAEENWKQLAFKLRIYSGFFSFWVFTF